MRSAISPAVLVSALTLACGAQPGTSPPAETPGGPAATASASEPASLEPAAAGSDSAQPESQAVDVTEAQPQSSGFDLDSWAEAHELEIALESDGCEPAEIGDKPGDVIWCRHRENRAEGVVLYLKTLYVARAKKLVKLIEIPYAVGQVALEEKRDAGDRQVLKLDFNRASDGKSVELADSSELDCAKADKENAEIRDTHPNTFASFDKAIRKVCAARGRYRWAGGTLRRAP